ncbi:hypothetical protein Slu03_16130 [Sediminihabitans luteus]|nr:hypothetical protein [Sediminihabitans luteus]GII99235.1 hypothetical protein Slu03_16130 [Sediminihabitans luteus]
MNEYAVTWPLWNEAGPAEPGELPVSESTSARLRSWARLFNDHSDWESGWDDTELVEPHRLEAHTLLRLVQDEVGDGDDVRLHLWETDL